MANNKEKRTLWILGASALSIITLGAAALMRTAKFVEMFSYDIIVRNIQIKDAHIFNVPPVLGNVQVTFDVKITNPLPHSHVIKDVIVRIFDKNNDNTQIANSLPYTNKVVIPAGGIANLSNIVVSIPVKTILGQLNIETIKNVLNAGTKTFNKTYDVKLNLKLDGIPGSTTTTIKI